MGGTIEASAVDRYSFFEGQCTSYTAWRLNQAGVPFHNHWRSSELANCPDPGSQGRPQGAAWNAGRWSHAWQWVYKARHLGILINTQPVRNAVYCSLSDSGFGHVGVVDEVSSDGTAVIAEYNWRGDQKFSRRPSVRVNGTTSFFLHFSAPPSPPPPPIIPAAPWGLTQSTTHSSALFDWATSSAAARYQIQVSTRSEGWSPTRGWDQQDRGSASSQLPVNATIIGSSNSAYSWVNGSPGSIEGPRGGVTYLWSVRLLLPSGAASPCTQPVRFTMASPPPPADDHANTLAGSTALPLNRALSGRLDASDVDVFRILNPIAQTVIFGTSGSTDTIGDLLDASGRPLATNDDHGSDRNFRIEAQLPTGTYYLRVRGYQGSSGAYSVSAAPRVGPAVAIDDHGNTPATATSLVGSVPRAGRIEIPGDADVFRLVVTTSRTVTVHSTGSTDTMGDLFTATGNLLAMDNDSAGTGNFRISRLLTPGTYFVRVRAHGNAVGAYSIQAN